MPPRFTGTPASRRRSPCTSRGTRSTTTPTSRSTPKTTASRSARSTRNTFQDDDYKLGSLTHRDPRIRQKAIDHHFECIDIMNETGSRDLKIWLADGTNYPGQDDMRARQDRLASRSRRSTSGSARTSASCSSTSSSSRRSTTPTFRTGGRRYAQVAALGDRAVVCLDTGHHAPGHQHRVHRHPAAAPRKARLVRLQLALLRG